MAKKNKFESSSLDNIYKLRKFKRERKSSYDRTGGNLDNIYLEPNEKRVIFDCEGPGCITHIWSTQNAVHIKHFLRGLIIRIWWDDEETPSVECPLGDFFGMGHARTKNFVSAPLQMSPQSGKGMNCWWPMPFKKHARIEIENDNAPGWHPKRNGKKKGGIIIYYYIDYEVYDSFPEYPENDVGYFHAQFNRVHYKKDIKRDPDTGEKYNFVEWQGQGGKNTQENRGYERNHLILHAKGKGQYVGCHINIDNHWRWLINWPGEGDDMIWIDDDIGGEPTLYGTGTEDYVNTAWGPFTKYHAPYHGIIKRGHFNYTGKITYYRYHIRDPIAFTKEIKVTIEHGHNNHRSGIWETTSYWYQVEPHANLIKLPSREHRMPRSVSKLKILIFILIIMFISIIIFRL
ncbi:MAG: DUF2961 domain-containing protein [Candidatus Lokiarchaeota archaeon]|nr:DUF2961 domain-containing protein [Candidatus Lokiarchaeota archaeon]